MKKEDLKKYNINYARTLQNRAIKYLSEYFYDQEDKNSIYAKFNNISGKTGRYFVQDYLFQKRTKRSNRVLMPFEHIVLNSISYEMLKSFTNGITIEFVNNQFFDQLKLSENNQNEVFKILKNKLGSDEDVSAIISIRSTGASSSVIQRQAYSNLIDFMSKNYNVDSKNPNLKEYLVQRKSPDIIKYSGIKNDKWKGFIYCCIKGGQQDTLNLHEKYKISSKEVQLFNPSVEYANEIVSTDITIILIYFALFSIHHDKKINELKSEINQLEAFLKENQNADEINEAKKEIKNKKEYIEKLKVHASKLSKIKSDVKDYLSTRSYNNSNLLKYAKNHMSLKNKPGFLTDPIQMNDINIENFAIKTVCNDSVDITHEISVSKNNYIWDEENKILLTAASPLNLFWSKHLSNMMQQDYSLKEYINFQKGIVEAWEQIPDYGESD